MMPDERTQKRLHGIAHYWHRKFRMSFDMLDDVISMAWVAWYERPTVEKERRLQQVFSQVRRDVITEIWRTSFHGGKIPKDARPLYRGVIDQVYDVDFIGRVRLREVMDICKRNTIGAGKGNSDHASTVRILAGLDKTKRLKHTVKQRILRLRKLLRAA